MTKPKISGIFPVKLQFDDDSFELTTAAFNKDRTLTLSSKKANKGTKFVAVTVDEQGIYHELECKVQTKDDDRVLAKWNLPS